MNVCAIASTQLISKVRKTLRFRAFKHPGVTPLPIYDEGGRGGWGVKEPPYKFFPVFLQK